MILFRHVRLSRIPLGERSARRRDLYLTTHNTHNRQISMPPAGIRTRNPASERPQTQALDRPATGTGRDPFEVIKCSFMLFYLYSNRQTLITNFVSSCNYLLKTITELFNRTKYNSKSHNCKFAFVTSSSDIPMTFLLHATQWHLMGGSHNQTCAAFMTCLTANSPSKSKPIRVLRQSLQCP